MSKLTQKYAEGLPAPEQGQIIHRDQAMPGFVLRITANCKSFIVERVVKGQRRRVTIGRLESMSVEKARKEAQRILAEMALGILPQDRQGDPTMGEVLQKFLQERDLAPKTKELYRQIMNRSVPDWFNIPITAITKTMIQTKHQELVRPTLSGTMNKNDADRTFHTLRVLMNFARVTYEVKGQKILDENPVKDALQWRWYGSNVRTGSIPDHRLEQFYRLIMAQPNKQARDFILILLLTGLRRNEVATLRWTDVSFEQKTLTIASGFNKSKRNHTLPLTDILIAILESRLALAPESKVNAPESPSCEQRTSEQR